MDIPDAGRIDLPANSFGETGPITVLHVDDQVAFLEMAAQFLEREHDSIVVETATSASAGLERLSEADIDCIVSDYQMPGLDGLEFLEAVREEFPDLPFILFTGKGSEEVASDAISAGVTDYLQKKPGADQFTVLANRVENAVRQIRTEKRFEESQRRLQTLLSNLPGMVYQCEYDRGWPMNFVSEGCVELTGYDPAELVERTVSYGADVIHPDDRERVWNAVREAVEGRDPFRVEYRIRTADDEKKWVWEQGRGVFDDGAVVALEGYITDVTDRKKSETELEYQSSLLEAQMETTIDGLLVVDEDRNVVSYNEQFVEMWGIPDTFVETESDEALLDWVVDHELADPEGFLDLVEELYDHPEETSRDEVQLTDGRVFDRYSAPVTGDDGTHFGRLWVFRDITERKDHERKLAEEREKYSTLVEQSHDGIAIVRDGEFVLVNPRFVDITGYEEADLLGMPFLEVIDPADRPLVRDRYERRLDPTREDPPSLYRVTFETQEGSQRIAELSASKIQYGGEAAGLVSVRDVTEQQQHEEELERLNDELEILNRVLRHDIRNDMTIILGWTEMLGEYIDEAGEEHLEKIISSSEHVVELTEITRDYVETLASDETMDVSPTRLQSILQKEITLRQEAYSDVEISVRGSIPDVEVRANEMLSSVFRNLLNNAVQHNDKDTPVVEIVTEERADDVRVTISDNGPGVPESQREAIFGKGERSLESSGTGIGLYLARTLIEQFGGDIRVADNDPVGATFTVTLPKSR